MIVVIDTNIWVQKTLLLSTAKSKALIYGLAQGDHSLGLPEVIEIEVVNNALKELQIARDNARSALNRIKTMMGKVPQIELPTDEEFKAGILRAFASTGVAVIRSKFTSEQAFSAGLRVLEGTPPNGPKNQQFKDCAIWEALKEFAKSSDVVFITQDKGFTSEDGQLAENLLAEESTLPNRINIYSDIGDFIHTLDLNVPDADKSQLREKLSKVLEKSLTSQSSQWEVNEVKITENNGYSFYLTEKSGVLAFDFEVEYVGHNVVVKGFPESQDVRFVLTGSALWNVPKEVVSEVSVEAIQLFIGDEQVKRRIVNLEASSGFNRIDRHVILEPIG